jgi:CHAD domain-containing protein
MSGAHRSRVGDRLVRAHLRAVAACAQALTHGATVDGVHDLRVALRRLRAALDLLDEARLRPLQHQAKRLQDRLGTLRDTQVELDWLKGRPGAAGAARVLSAREMREAAHLSALNLEAFIRGAAKAADTGESRSARRLDGRHVRRELRRRLRRLQRRLGALEEDMEPARIHRARVAVKKLRYELEIVAPAFPTTAGALLTPLARLQRELGAVHDADVWATGPGAPSVKRLAQRARRHAQVRAGAELDRWRHSRRVSEALASWRN